MIQIRWIKAGLFAFLNSASQPVSAPVFGDANGVAFVENVVIRCRLNLVVLVGHKVDPAVDSVKIKRWIAVLKKPAKC